MWIENRQKVVFEYLCVVCSLVSTCSRNIASDLRYMMCADKLLSYRFLFVVSLFYLFIYLRLAKLGFNQGVCREGILLFDNYFFS